MFRWFIVADKGADVLMRWAAVIMALSAAYSWLTKHATFFGQLNWPDAILLGVGLALVTVLVVAAVLAAVRYFRPLAAPSSASTAAVVDEPPPASPKPNSPHLTTLIARREALTADLKRSETSASHCKQMVDLYRRSLARFSREKVVRPTQDPMWPDGALENAIRAFTNTQLKPHDWMAGFNRPKAAMDEWQNPAVATRQVRQMFDPEHNRR